MRATNTVEPYTDVKHFAGLRAEAKRDPKAALGKVAHEFEALFVQMMLKAAREATPEGGLFDSNELRFYNEMFDNQVALSMAEQGGIGFDALLRTQLAPGPAGDNGPAAEDSARRAFAAINSPYVPQTEPETDDQPVDITTWAARVIKLDADAPDSVRGAPQQHFVASLREHAQRAAEKLGTTPEILMAQAALETGWGKHVVGGANGAASNNLFSIKADRSWDGATVTQPTLEILGGKPVRVSAAFRAYDDIGAAFDDYVDFIQSNPRYQRALQRAADPRAYVQELQRAGYATDPRYAQKILSIHGQLAAASPDRG